MTVNQLTSAHRTFDIRAKKILDRAATLPVLQPVRKIKAHIDRGRIFRYDKSRYIKNYSSRLHNVNRAMLDARLMFHAHALEKGLSHEDLKYGFGLNALNALASTMIAYNEQGFDMSNNAYANALSVLKEYLIVHERANYDTSYLSKIFGELLNDVETCKTDIGGTITLRLDTKIKNRNKNFKDLFVNRYSIREFSKQEVEIKDIEEAISISTKSPSVCNRQPSRVRVYTERKIIGEILRLQGGFNGYALPPVLLLVTADVNNFLDVTERNQSYIDGGSFSTSLLLSLEYVGLAACPLNTMFNVRQDKTVRKLINIPQRENFIMFIAVGHFKNRITAPKSFRYPTSEIVRSV